MRDSEIWVEISSDNLEIGSYSRSSLIRLSSSSVDLPSGSINGGVSRQIRSDRLAVAQMTETLRLSQNLLRKSLSQ